MPNARSGNPPGRSIEPGSPSVAQPAKAVPAESVIAVTTEPTETRNFFVFIIVYVLLIRFTHYVGSYPEASILAFVSPV